MYYHPKSPAKPTRIWTPCFSSISMTPWRLVCCSWSAALGPQISDPPETPPRQVNPEGVTLITLRSQGGVTFVTQRSHHRVAQVSPRRSHRRCRGDLTDSLEGSPKSSAISPYFKGESGFFAPKIDTSVTPVRLLRDTSHEVSLTPLVRPWRHLCVTRLRRRGVYLWGLPLGPRILPPQ